MLESLRRRVNDAGRGDVTRVLEPRALAEAERLRALSAADDLDAGHLLGLFHLRRYQILPEGQDSEELRLALECLYPVYLVDPGTVPASLHPLLDHAATAAELTPRLRRVQELLDDYEDGLDPASMETAIDLLRAELADGGHPAIDLKATLAASLNTLGRRLGEVGRRADALPVVLEAAALYRGLIEEGRLAHRADFAATLWNLALQLKTAGRWAESAAAMRESVALYRALAAEDPGTYRAMLAGALSNLSGHLGDIGEPQEAAAAAVEAVGLDRAPGGSRAGLAVSLINYAVNLSSIGAPGEALSAAAEAVDIGRELVETDAHAYGPDLAMALNAMAQALSDLGRGTQAVRAAREAAAILRPYGDAQAEQLTTVLNDLSNWLSDLGAHAEALRAADEAVAVERALAADDPEGRAPDLLSALVTQCARYTDTEQLEESLAVAQEAVVLGRGFESRHPDSLLPALGQALHGLANALYRLGDWDRALDVCQETVLRYRRRAASGTEQDRFLLAWSLLTFTQILSDAGRREESERACDEAVALFGELASAHPAVYQRHLAKAHLLLAAQRSADPFAEQEALEAAEAAVSVRQLLAARHPEGLQPLLAEGLLVLANLRRRFGCPEDAVAAARESIGIARRAAAEEPRFHRSLLVKAAAALALALSRTREHQEAATLAAEALELARDGGLDPGSALNALADVLMAAGRQQEALPLFRELAELAEAGPATRIAALRDWAGLVGEPAAALAVYERALELLPLAAPVTARRRDREFALSRGPATTLGAEAAAAAISAGRPERALEILERSRGILHGDALDVRGDLARLRAADPATAQRLTLLRNRLHTLDLDRLESFAVVRAGTPELAGEKVARLRRELVTELTLLTENVRGWPGFQDFLRPPGFAELARQGAEGPVVIINVAPARSDALILTMAGPEPELRQVPLNLTTGELTGRFLAFMEALGDALDTESSTVCDRLRAADRLAEVLAWLWDRVAEPVLTDLKPVASGASRPRLWWCPTGLLSYLPLHAAGHRDGDGVLDQVVPSYTPTVTALAHARAAAGADSSARGALLATMPETPGAAPLPGTVAEAAAIVRLLPGTLHLSGAEATGERVIAELPHRQLAHFACHVAYDPRDPSDSLLLLHDHLEHPLTVAAVSGLRVTGARLAYLSACNTTMPALHLPDESIHVTGAFQLAGYPHVIGTLWEVDDQTSKTVAELFYAELTRDGTAPPDVRHSARALATALRRVRDGALSDVAAWAAYLHAGI
ncbi:CHAT domain-containing protein [Nonomuraea sp. MTCD27]|uniref:CHAT domain-containing tetratricopeptide repeat protein n=1 Tax=Nonomuraea sp. MTCD27 TaxID=1676747 RepID=UPI0035C06696